MNNTQSLKNIVPLQEMNVEEITRMLEVLAMLIPNSNEWTGVAVGAIVRKFPTTTYRARKYLTCLVNAGYIESWSNGLGRTTRYRFQ